MNSVELHEKEELKGWIVTGNSWMNSNPDYMCPHCGSEQFKKTQFCPDCGKELNINKDSHIYKTTSNKTIVV